MTGGWNIYMLNGSTFGAFEGKEAAPRAMLFSQQPRRHVYDVTDKQAWRTSDGASG